MSFNSNPITPQFSLTFSFLKDRQFAKWNTQSTFNKIIYQQSLSHFIAHYLQTHLNAFNFILPCFKCIHSQYFLILHLYSIKHCYVNFKQHFQFMSTGGITCMYQGLFGERAIYLSDVESAHNLTLLKSLNITAVLSVAKEFKITYPQSLVQEHLQIPAIDSEDYDIQSIFYQTFQFIDSMHVKRNVLIHCAYGVSRSAAVFIAYRIRKLGQSLENALSSAAKRRPIINPNKGFLKALETYSKIYQKTSYNPSQYGQIHRDRMKKLRQSLIAKKHLPEKVKQLQNLNGEQKESGLVIVQNKIGESINMGRLESIYQKKQQIQKKLNELQSYYRDLNKDRAKSRKSNSVEKKSISQGERRISKHSSTMI